MSAEAYGFSVHAGVRVSEHNREGQTYSAKTLSENRRSVYDLGMFSSVTHRALNYEEANIPLNVEFEVNERKTRTGRLGIEAIYVWLNNKMGHLWKSTSGSPTGVLANLAIPRGRVNDSKKDDRQ